MRQPQTVARTEAFGLKKRLQAAAIVFVAVLPIALQINLVARFFLGSGDEYSSSLISFDTFLQTLAMVMAAWLIFSRRLSVTALAACLWTALALEETSFFSSVLHPIMMSLHTYPDWFGHGNTVNQSDQYAKIMLAFIIMIVLVARLVRKHHRSIDRLYTALVAGSILLTSLLFHWVTVQGVQETRKAREVSLRLAAEAPRDLVPSICKEIGARCITGPIKNLPIKTGDAKLDSMLETLSQGANEQIHGFTKSAATQAPLAANDNNRLNTHHVVYHRTKSGEYRFVIETTANRATLLHWQTLYGALAITAHLTWLLGGLHLLFWHKRRMARRQQREIEIHDFVEKRFYEFIQG